MSKYLFLVPFGFLEFLLRLAFVLLGFCFILPLFVWCIDDDIEDLLTPILWEKL